MITIKNFKAAALSLLMLSPGLTWGNETPNFPNKPISIVVPYAAGGLTDILARKVGEKLAQKVKQPVFVDNRAGGNTIIATEYVLSQPSDGYTLFSTNTSLIQTPLLQKVRYDESRDFKPVAQYALTPLMLVVRSEHRAKTVSELIADVKARPGRTSYGSIGAGGAIHILSEAFRRAAALDSVHVAYRGEAPLLNDFLGGQIDWYIGTPVSLLPYVKSGQVRALAVTGSDRLPVSPEVPTFKEAGVPGLEMVGWHGIFISAKTPLPIVNLLSKEISEIAKSPELADYMRDGALIPTGLDTQEFAKRLPQDRETNVRLIRENNIKTD